MFFFKCPADRRQIGIMAERIFDKQKPLFMEIYNEITVKPYSYILIDNKADTAVRERLSVVYLAPVFHTHYPAHHNLKH